MTVSKMHYTNGSKSDDLLIFFQQTFPHTLLQFEINYLYLINSQWLKSVTGWKSLKQKLSSSWPDKYSRIDLSSSLLNDPSKAQNKHVGK